MSFSKKVEAVCPKCKRPQLFEKWSVVNVTMNPAMKDRVVNGDLFALTCVGCGEKTPMQNSLVYADTEKGFMVHLRLDEEEEEDAEGLPPEPRKLKLRRVDTEMQFYEKIRIFDDGLDDRIVEMEKLALIHLGRTEWQYDPLDVLYQGISKAPQGGQQVGYFVVLEQGAKNLTFPFPDKYKQSVRAFKPALPDPATEMGVWVKVDGAYAEACLAALDEKRSRPRGSAVERAVGSAKRRSRAQGSRYGITPARRRPRAAGSERGIAAARRTSGSKTGIPPAKRRRRRFKR